MINFMKKVFCDHSFKDMRVFIVKENEISKSMKYLHLYKIKKCTVCGKVQILELGKDITGDILLEEDKSKLRRKGYVEINSLEEFN